MAKGIDSWLLAAPMKLGIGTTTRAKRNLTARAIATSPQAVAANPAIIIA